MVLVAVAAWGQAVDGPPVGASAEGFSGLSAPWPARHTALTWATLASVRPGAAPGGAAAVAVTLQRLQLGVAVPVGVRPVGLGDAWLDARLTVVEGAIVAVGARAGLSVPGLAPTAGVQVAAEGWPVQVATDLGVVGGPSPSIIWANAARWRLPDSTRLGFTGQLRARTLPGARLGAEAAAGLEVYPNFRGLTLGLEVGRQLAGTDPWRVTFAVRSETPPLSQLEWVGVHLPHPRDRVPHTLQGALDRGEALAFTVGEPFRPGTTRLRRVGRRDLVAVADWLAGEEAALTVEGYAGPGDPLGLALLRAERVRAFLAARGVSEGRVSCVVRDTGPDPAPVVRFRVVPEGSG